MQTQSIDFHELFQRALLEARAAWRYRWHALIVAWAVMIVGALLVFSLPNKYAASAQVYADTEALTNPLLSGVAVQPDVRARLQIITHTLLSRPNLETIADKTGLSLRATTPTDKDALLDSLGSAVAIKDAGTKNLYNLSYADPDPKMAQKVVQAFLGILMNDTLGANNASTQTAQNFLQQQVRSYGDRLNDAEKKLADFQKANVGYIPSQGGSSYFTRLQAAEAQLQTLQAQYDTAVASRATTQQQMRAMTNGASSSGIDPRTQGIDQQIASYEQQLSKLLLSYTDQYPDVVSTRRMIEQLKARRDALKKDGSDTSMMGVASDNPVYQDMQRSMFASQVSIQTLATQIALQKQQIAALKGNVDKISDVQATLQGLTRNYDLTKKQYDQLVERLNTAELSQDATQSGNNLKFRIINPPVVPLSPVSPKRGLLLLIVFALAVALGAGFAYFMHKIRPVFASIESLRRSGDYPVLGALSLIVSRSRRQDQRREVAGFCTGAGLLAAVLVLGFAFDGELTKLVQHFFVMGGRMSIVEKAAEKLKALQAEPTASLDIEVAPSQPASTIERLQDARPAEPPQQTTPPWHIDLKALGRVGLLPADDEAADRLADELRRVKRPLIRNVIGKRAKSSALAERIMVTSAVPGEGKTFTAVNLALSLAREPDFDVLLVDGDAPKSNITRVLGLDRHPGLMDALADERCRPADIVVQTDIPNLLVVPAGTRSRLTSELFGSLRMDYVLEELGGRSRRRLMVFDSSPLLVTSEAQVLASHMGQIVVVVAAGLTGQHLVHSALQNLGDAQYVGLILNMSRLPASENYYDSYYGQ